MSALAFSRCRLLQYPELWHFSIIAKIVLKGLICENYFTPFGVKNSKFKFTAS